MIASGGRVMIVAFEGWNDAGEAASMAAKTVIGERGLGDAVRIDPELYYDYQFTRPVSRLSPDGGREIVWPGAIVHTPADDGRVLVLLGSEPARSWQAFAAELVDTMLALDVETVVLLGSLLADVPHTRPISIISTSENAELRDALDIDRSRYEGPVGILSIVGQAAEQAGIPVLSVWAQVPHYVHNSPNPKAALAIVDRVAEVTGEELGREALLTEANAWEDGVDSLAGDDDDMAAYIEHLERARDTVESPEASGEAIAAEFERYLHDDDGDGAPGKPGGPMRP